MSEPQHPDQYKKQFLLSAQHQTTHPSWVNRTLGTYHLAHCTTLPVHDATLDGTRRGVLIGWTPETLTTTDTPPSLVLRTETLGDMGGRWLFIGEGEDSEYEVRLDPAGSFSVVYSTEHGLAASSTAVIPPEFLEEDADLERAIGLPEERTWYPFGLTPYRNVRRLLPNHALPFDTFEPVRLSRATALAGKDDESLLDTVALHLQKLLRTLAQAAPLTVPLTAGVDTRMILAGLRSYKYAAWFFTIQPGATAGLDVFAARHLAETFDLNHHVIRRVRSAAEEERWFERTGRSVAAGSLRNAGVMALLPPDQVYLKGMGGELSRGFYYRPGDHPGMSLSVEEIILRFHLPVHDTVFEAGQNWLDKVEAEDSFDLLDILYLENRLGCWAAPTGLGDLTPVTTIWPMNQTSILEALRRLSHETKVQKSAGRRIVKRLWPELLSVPVNEPFGRFRRRQIAAKARRKVEGFLRRVTG